MSNLAFNLNHSSLSLYPFLDGSPLFPHDFDGYDAYNAQQFPLNTELFCITRKDDEKIFEQAADTFEQSYGHSPYNRDNWAKVWARTKQHYIANQCCAQKKRAEQFLKEKYDQCTTQLDDAKDQLHLLLRNVTLKPSEQCDGRTRESLSEKIEASKLQLSEDLEALDQLKNVLNYNRMIPSIDDSQPWEIWGKLYQMDQAFFEDVRRGIRCAEENHRAQIRNSDCDYFLFWTQQALQSYPGIFKKLEIEVLDRCGNSNATQSSASHTDSNNTDPATTFIMDLKKKFEQIQKKLQESNKDF